MSIQSKRKIIFALWRLLGIGMILLYFFPVRNGPIRLLLVLGFIGLWLGALILFWHRKPLRYTVLGLAALLSLVAIAPGSEGDRIQLRQEYLHSLQNYEGCRYIWGGEKSTGIDCSGLIRRGLIDAEARLGLRTLNPRLLRQSFDLWWHDCSANALKDGYRGWTHPVEISPSLNGLSNLRIQPGDVAVTSSGLHTLAYLGDSTWIEADPNVGKVIKVTVPAPNNSWFTQPMHIVRWKPLS
jgi:hypothetical protein